MGKGGSSGNNGGEAVLRVADGGAHQEDADTAAGQFQQELWERLRRLTPARIGLGRTGHSQPTGAVLAFGVAHAQARDAVHQPLDGAALARDAAGAGLRALQVQSAAPDRATYLRRPDLGRRLNESSRVLLEQARDQAGDTLASFAAPAPPDVVFVVADGLSAFAAQRHALPLLAAVRERLSGWRIGPVVIASQARVALGDEIGALLGARQVVMLIGERPGLSSPDSLGVYLTYDPRPGRTDAQRNCISNVRPAGLPYAAAAAKLLFLLRGAARLGCSGVGLKEDAPGLDTT